MKILEYTLKQKSLMENKECWVHIYMKYSQNVLINILCWIHIWFNLIKIWLLNFIQDLQRKQDKEGINTKAFIDLMKLKFMLKSLINWLNKLRK